MADKTNSHSYEIVIKLNNGERKKTEKKSGNPLSFISEFHSEMKNAPYGIGIAYKEGESFVKNAIAFNVSNVGLTTGNSESQERAQLHWNSTLKIASTALALGSGNYAAAAISIITEAVNICFKDAQIKLRQYIENESLALSRERAGIAFNRSRSAGTK